MHFFKLAWSQNFQNLDKILKKDFMQSQNILFSGILSTERTWMEQKSALIAIKKKIS